MAKFLYSRLNHKPNNVHGFAFAIVLIIILVVIGAMLYSYLAQGPQDEVISKYIHAAKTGSSTELYDILAREYDGANIDSDLKELKGVTFAYNSGNTPSKENGLMVIIHLRGLKGIVPFKKDITLEGMQTAWYLVNGNLKKEYR